MIQKFQRKMIQRETASSESAYDQSQSMDMSVGDAAAEDEEENIFTLNRAPIQGS